MIPGSVMGPILATLVGCGIVLGGYFLWEFLDDNFGSAASAEFIKILAIFAILLLFIGAILLTDWSK